MYNGSIVALITPMDNAGEIDWEALEELIEWHLQSGTNGIVAVGTTGESATLNPSEHINVIRFIVERVRGRCFVIAGTGANATREAVELNEAAYLAKADAALSVVPYYNKPSQRGIYAHYAEIDLRAQLPVLLYNVPGRTVVDMLPETVLELGKLDNIVGIKDASGDISRVAAYRTIEGFSIISGDDPTYLEFLKVGGHGVISVTANVAPAQMQAIYDAHIAGDSAKSEAIDSAIAELHHAMFWDSAPGPTKYVLQQLGRIHAGVRLPIVLPEKDVLTRLDVWVDKLQANVGLA